ncbi:MAG: pyruvate carboxylase subunit B, partial [Candidatus Latescibacteria bacterium]|nr:pyruvate carboxylase subunit B [Candidatus Latescibacterota bacterium]
MIAKPKPVKITDTTLRDGHQSLWATRMKTAEMLPILEKLDAVGYWSLEMWGGATFDVAMRFLNEDPWERLSSVRKQIKKTKIQMLLRGQNIVGYRNYPDDLLEAFIEKTAERGMDIFRIFDALNDVRNIQKAIECVKKYKKHAQGTLCYTVSPVHTIDYFLEVAQKQADLGIDSICIKDMAGIIAPDISYELVKRLKEEIKLPVQLHTHSSSGMAVASYLKAVEAGVDIIDTAHAPLAFGTSQPAVESIIAMLTNSQYNPQLNTEMVEQVSNYFDQMKTERCIKYDKLIDEMVVIHQIPGGMASNLISQLQQQNAADKLQEVLAEVPKVRKDMGYPPLVTPTSQIVGVQAVFNVLAGERYKIIPNEIKEYVRGLYGKPPVPIKDAIRRKILGSERPITIRPADLLEPVMVKVKQELDLKYVKKEEDYITYALFPEQALKFFETRENPEKFVREEKEEERAMKQEDKQGLDIIRELLELSSKHNLAELEWEYSGNKVKIRRVNQHAPLNISQTTPENQQITHSTIPVQPQIDGIPETRLISNQTSVTAG